MFFVALSFVIGASVVYQVTANFQQFGLYRDQQIAFGNFKLNQGYKLSATKISSYLVTAVSHCILSCVSDSRCKSINFAVNPDSNNLHVCELLDTNKYRAASGDFQVNVDFLHYSPQVSKVSRAQFFNSFSFILTNVTYIIRLKFNGFLVNHWLVR